MIIEYLLPVFTAIGYSLRFSFVKDLKKFPISGNLINLCYRVISLPIILLTFLILKGSLPDFSKILILWTISVIVINVVLSIIQVNTYQKYQFSDIESLNFLSVIITVIGGYIFFNELLDLKQILGVILILIAIVSITYKEMVKVKSSAFIGIFPLILISSATDIITKKVVLISSPLFNTLIVTIGMVLFFGIKEIIENNSRYNFKNSKANILLIYMGLSGIIAYLTLNYSLKLLPVGIVTTIVSTRIFISLWISKSKYNESSIAGKVIPSIIAVCGVFLIFT